ncbi:kinase-like protein [Serendipita vermifera]|nr:kinase-like protein [Serendipita vermifera]
MTTLQLLNSTDIDQIDERIPELSGQIDLIDLQPKFLGSYSHVYRGYLRGHMVAVKVLVATGSLASMRRKVKRERIIWALLSHPNIIPLWGYTENDPRFGQFGALISPWCTKRDSGTWLEQEGYRSPLSHRIRLCYEVVNALEYLHTYNPILVHGDLKPGNILIDESCTAKVCDFGLIRTISGDSGLTTTTVHTGTDRYLAPEFFTSSEVIIPTPESDIYAFGCVGLKFLFLKDPYAHRKDNRFGWIFSDIKAGIMPSDKPNDLSLECNELWQLIEVCWDRDPTARTTARLARDFLSGFQTEGDIITDLPLGQAEPLHPGSMSSINEHLNKPDGLSIPIPSRAPVLVMRALYKFRAADAEQLSFKKGNVIEIIDQSDKALWKGRLDGREGYVPSNYMVPL